MKHVSWCKNSRLRIGRLEMLRINRQVLICWIALIGQSLPAEDWQLTRKGVEFDRCDFAPMLALSEPGIVERVKKVGVVAGFKEGQPWNPVAGWAEYDIQIPQTGWYDLDVPANVWLMEYF